MKIKDLVYNIYNNDLDLINDDINKVSLGRYDLRIDTLGRFYIYDYDFKEATRSEVEMQDILNCLNIGGKI